MSSTYTPNANRQTSTSTTPDRIVIHPLALNSLSLHVVDVMPALNNVDRDDARLSSNNRPR